MIDIDPPHAHIESWRDILIHLAIIVVGVLIAIGLEQTAEYIHHRHQRDDLLAALRNEASHRIPLIASNLRYFHSREQWYRDCLQAANAAIPSNGSITFTVPPQSSLYTAGRPLDSVWPAAAASGKVAVLHTDETEAWGRVDFFAQRTEKRVEAYGDAISAMRAICDHLGINLTPGASIRITTDGRDELTRSLGTVIETEEQFIRDDIGWAGSSNAALHGAYTINASDPYYTHAEQTLSH